MTSTLFAKFMYYPISNWRFFWTPTLSVDVITLVITGWPLMQLISFFQAVLEIHDEVAAQIENYTEEVEYMDGVSSVDEEDGDEERRLPDVAEVGRDRDPYKNAQDNKLLDCKHLRTLKSEKYCECFIFIPIRLQGGPSCRGQPFFVIQIRVAL